MLGGIVGRVSYLTTTVNSICTSSSCCTISTISPLLLHCDKLLPTSSFCSSASGTFPLQSIRSSAHICFPHCPSFPLQKSSASPHNSLTFSSLSSPSSSGSDRSCLAPFAAPFSASFPASSQLGGALMSSRLAPAYSSLCGLTRLEGLIPFEGLIGASSCRKRRHHLGNKRNLGRPDRNAKASVEIRSISSALSDRWCWREGGGGGGGGGQLKSRCMETDRNVQRIECYSSSQAGGGGGDQPVSSSVLPPLPANPAVSKVKGMTISFCPRCGGATEEKIPVGEHEKRYVCTVCGAVHYQNPKMVVGCLVEHEGKILLCKRNIEPSFGLWTLPAGYMEMGESAAEGAARETLEEACAHVQVLSLFAHIDIPLIGQSHIYFRAQMKDPHFAPGPESIECALFKLNEIPFDSLAFSSIQLALKMYAEDTKTGKMRVHHAVIDKRPGASPSDLKGFVVRDVLTS